MKEQINEFNCIIYFVGTVQSQNLIKKPKFYSFDPERFWQTALVKNIRLIAQFTKQVSLAQYDRRTFVLRGGAICIPSRC